MRPVTLERLIRSFVVGGLTFFVFVNIAIAFGYLQPNAFIEIARISILAIFTIEYAVTSIFKGE